MAVGPKVLPPDFNISLAMEMMGWQDHQVVVQERRDQTRLGPMWARREGSPVQSGARDWATLRHQVRQVHIQGRVQMGTQSSGRIWARLLRSLPSYR